MQRSLTGLIRGLQPDKDTLHPAHQSALYCLLYQQHPPVILIFSAVSSHLVCVVHHISMQNIPSQHADTCDVFATQDATPKATSLVSDPMDPNHNLPDYLAEFFLHSPGQVRHTSPSALTNLR